MAVSLPTAADVRKIREQAVKSATEQAEVVKTPLLAVLGAYEKAFTGIADVYGSAKGRATAGYEAAEKFVTDIPSEVEALRGKLTSEELRKLVDGLVAQIENYYDDLAKRGESTWISFREQPQVKQAFTSVEEFTGKVDARVDSFVDDAHDAAEKALSTLTRETRSVGEKVAVRAQKVAEGVSGTVSEVAADASKAVSDATENVTAAVGSAGKDAAKAVEEAGKDTAEAVEAAGDEVASTTRSTTRRAANRTAPAKPAAKTTERKPAARRTNGSKTPPKTS